MSELTPFEIAVRLGDAKAARAALKAGADPDAMVDGEPALVLAAASGAVELVAVLLEFGADIEGGDGEDEPGTDGRDTEELDGEDEEDEDEEDEEDEEEDDEAFEDDFDVIIEDARTPLAVAAVHGNLDVMRLLVEQGAAVDLDGLGNPLVLAASADQDEAVELLLDFGADLLGDGSVLPLVQAASYGAKAAVEVLLLRGADPNQLDGGGDSPLAQAAEFGHTAVVAQLLEAGAAVDGPSRSGPPVEVAAVGGHRETFELLCRHSREPPLVERGCAMLERVEQRTARVANEATQDLIQAAADGDVEEVEAMLADPEVDVNGLDSAGETALMEAAYGGSLEIVERLLRAGADPNLAIPPEFEMDVGQTALMKAAAAPDANVAIVEALLRAGGEVDGADARGRTPLFFALGNPDVVALLCERGADVHRRDAAGFTALMLAVLGGHPDDVDRLRDAGATDEGLVHVRLLEAAEVGDVDGLQGAIQEGADVARFGGMALLTAAREGHEPVVRALVEAGVDVNVREDDDAFDGYTPLLNAIIDPHLGIVRVLLEAGADPQARVEDGNALDHVLEALEDEEDPIDAFEQVVTLLLERGARPSRFAFPPSRADEL